MIKTKINPRPIDTTEIKSAAQNIQTQFANHGYLNAITEFSLIPKKNAIEKINLRYNVYPGQLFLLENVGFDLMDKQKNRLFLDLIKNREYLKPGARFDYREINNQLLSIQEKMTQNGYIRFSKDHIRVNIDTTTAYLNKIPPKLKDGMSREFQLYFYLDNNIPPATQTLYKIKNIYIRNFRSDQDKNDDSILPHIYYLDKDKQFHPNFIKRQVFANTIGRYASSRAVKYIINNFWNARSFSLVSQFKEYPTDSTMDLYIELSPRNKMSIGFHSDVSYNDGARLIANSATNQVVDISLSTEFSIYNLMKRSIQYSLFLRGGVQLNPSNKFALSSYSISVTNNFRIPGLFLFGYYLPSSRKIISPSSNFSVDVTYFKRRDLFDLYNIRFSTIYQWQLEGGYQFSFSPFNLEFYYFDLEKSFEEYLKTSSITDQNPYRDGQLITMLFSVSKRFRLTRNFSMLLSLGLEEAGLYGNLFNAIVKEESLPRFFRQEFTAIFNKSFLKDKSSMVLRLYYGNNIYYSDNNIQTPYFRKFFSGGAYSMRAWQPRSLGFGSSTPSSNMSTDFLGDLKFEFNLEFRFDIFRLGVLKTEGALFTDVGNIWAKGNLAQSIGERASFSGTRFLDDLAVSGGLGLRFNFQAIIVRFDWSYILKDPQKDNQLRFNRNITDGVLQIGIGYPF